MTEGNPEQHQDLVAMYGDDAAVSINGIKLSLGQAMQMEAAFCPPEAAEARRDPALRQAKLAQMLFDGGSLLPDHEYLLPHTTDS